MNTEVVERIADLKDKLGVPVVYWVDRDDLQKGIAKVKPIKPQHLPIGRFLVAITVGEDNVSVFMYNRKGKASFEINMPIQMGAVTAIYDVHEETEDGYTVWKADITLKGIDVPPEIISSILATIPIEMTKIGLLNDEGKVRIER